MRSGRPPWLLVLGIAAVVALALAHRDEIRGRAENALGRGMPDREAALARGFVLGEDERIDARTVEDFRRAGLSHLLAVSGQNVALLALLAMPLLAAFGIPLRARLLWILGAIVVYVPLAGAGPSILRAGVMGGVGVLATLAGRRTSRAYALALAAVVTLAADPAIAADIGWQLSFAAVLGILAIVQPLRTAIAARTGARGWRGALAEGVAVTVAATLATAPLIAFHFEAVSTTTLVANLLALPAVAPAMWLGMLDAVAGQVPGFPVSLLNALCAPLLAYIAQVAAWCGRPGWAYLHVRLGMTCLVASYLTLAVAMLGLPGAAAPSPDVSPEAFQAPLGRRGDERRRGSSRGPPASLSVAPCRGGGGRWGRCPRVGLGGKWRRPCSPLGSGRWAARIRARRRSGRCDPLPASGSPGAPRRRRAARRWPRSEVACRRGAAPRRRDPHPRTVRSRGWAR
jgi:ComEC/Rec2-related protein